MKTRSLLDYAAEEPLGSRENTCAIAQVAYWAVGNNRQIPLADVGIEKFAGADEEPVWAVTKKLFEWAT